MSRWPKTVPILTAANITKGRMVDPDDQNRRCLLGWIFVTFPLHADGVRCMIYKKMSNWPLMAPQGLEYYNDTHSRREVASLWNEIMQDLGYTEVVE
jgi:hypothetical protein